MSYCSFVLPASLPTTAGYQTSVTRPASVTVFAPTGHGPRCDVSVGTASSLLPSQVISDDDGASLVSVVPRSAPVSATSVGVVLPPHAPSHVTVIARMVDLLSMRASCPPEGRFSLHKCYECESFGPSPSHRSSGARLSFCG